MRLDLPGAECAHDNRELALAGVSNNVGWWCDVCEKFVSGWLPKSHRDLLGVDRAKLRRIAYGDPIRCEICEKTTATPELHHWCPRALYKDSGNEPPGEGPQAWLCKPCHDTWHQIVTPMLKGGSTRERTLNFLRAQKSRMTDQQWDEFVATVAYADQRVVARRSHPRTEAA